MSWVQHALAALALLVGLGSPPPPAEPVTLIRGAHVFDGSGAPARVRDVLIRGERIAEVRPRIRAARGATVVEGRGMTLLPGLHDLHTHLRSPALDGPDDLGKAYAEYLLSGVTAATDFSVSGEMLTPIRTMTAAGKLAAPRLSLAIRLGVPGGHGTEYGWGDEFTLEVSTPRAARQAMRRALRYRPDVIKVFADGWRYGRSPDLNSMDTPTLAAIVEEAHGTNIPVITHTVTLAGAKRAAAAGVDALGHGVGDLPVDEELIALMRSKGTAYVPTLVVYEPQQDRSFTDAEWRALAPAERAREERRRAAAPQPIPEREARRWAVMQENVRRLKAAGIPIGVGTDAGIGGVYHGFSTLREIDWLVRLGHSPAEALRAATATSAAILRRPGEAVVRAGAAADLILVAGRPDQRIEDLRSLRRVWVSGREVALAPLRRLIDAEAMSALPVTRMAGPIDTGTRDDGRTDLDTLPYGNGDSGVDRSRMTQVRTERGRLIVADLGAAPQPFAQLVLPLTPGGVAVADARGFSGIAFEARGSGRYVMLLESYGVGQRGWFRAEFNASGAPAEIRLPFSAFRSESGRTLDLAALRGSVFRLDGEPGARRWLEIGRVRFY